MKVLQRILIAFVPFISMTVWAQGSDKPDASVVQEAVQDTKSLLRDRGRRDQTLTGEAAKKVDKGLDDLTGSRNTSDEVYGLTADLLEPLMKKAGDDPDKLQKMVDEAQKNPEAFAETFTPEQREKLRAIAGEISKNKGTPASKP